MNNIKMQLEKLSNATKFNKVQDLKRLQKKYHVYYCYLCKSRIDVSGDLKMINHYERLSDNEILCDTCRTELLDMDLSEHLKEASR